MSNLRKEFTEQEKEKFRESFERFTDAMKNHDEELKGQVIAVNFKSKKIVKSRCKNGKKAA